MSPRLHPHRTQIYCPSVFKTTTIGAIGRGPQACQTEFFFTLMASSPASVGVQTFTPRSSIKFSSLDFLATATRELCLAGPKRPLCGRQDRNALERDGEATLRKQAHRSRAVLPRKRGRRLGREVRSEATTIGRPITSVDTKTARCVRFNSPPLGISNGWSYRSPSIGVTMWRPASCGVYQCRLDCSGR